MRRYYLSYADWTYAEYTAAFASLIRGKVSDGENVGRLARRLEKIYAPSAVYALNFGHSAIRIALQLFGRQAGDRIEVVVPAYVCPSVIDTVAACGLEARLVRVGADLNIDPTAVAEALDDKTLAVIVPHMYGCPAQIAQIEALCRVRGVYLIDDAAQVVGIEHQGRLLGTFGEMGILSFAQSKTVVTGVRGSGGALLVNNPCFDESARNACRDLRPAAKRAGAYLHFLWNYVWARYTGSSGYYFSRILDALRIGSAVADCPARIGNMEAGIALAQLDRLPAICDRKTLVAEWYHRELRNVPEVRFPQYAAGRYLSRVMLLLPDGADAAGVRTAMKRRGVEARLGYGVFGPLRQDAGDARALSRRLIGVPCGPDIDEKDVRRICAVLKEALQSYSLAGNSSHETHQAFH